LIGTSLLRNVNPDKLINCDLIAKGGAKIDDISKIIAAMPASRKFKEVILIAGSIDLESGSQADIINALKAFAVCASDRTENVKISSVLPRTDKNLTEATKTLNTEIKHMCDTDGYVFIDHDPVFHVMSGDINRALLTEDGLHLSQAGVESLVRNCVIESKGSPYTSKRYVSQKTRTLFKGHDHPLSNFYPVKGLKISGRYFHTSEAAYQFEKATFMGNEYMAQRIQDSRTGIQAMRLGSKVKSNEAWQTQKTKIMENVIHAKLRVCKDAKDALMNSGTSEIVEDTGHPFWACGLDGNGQNMMGKILMMYRRKLKEDPSQFRGPPVNSSNDRRWATREHQPLCYRCGEAGHNQERCRHRQDVNCWACGYYGHKEKNCYTFNGHQTRRTYSY
jgi:ribA/ribD-fused uncharacterized protein